MTTYNKQLVGNQGDGKTPSLSEYMRVQFHELGHNLGLQHSMTTMPWFHEYGDHTCSMGSGRGFAYNAPQAVTLGWLSRDEVLDLTGPRSRTLLCRVAGASAAKASRFR